MTGKIIVCDKNQRNYFKIKQTSQFSKDQFFIFGITRPGIEPGLPDHWRTLS